MSTKSDWDSLQNSTGKSEHRIGRMGSEDAIQIKNWKKCLLSLSGARKPKKDAKTEHPSRTNLISTPTGCKPDFKHIL